MSSIGRRRVARSSASITIFSRIDAQSCTIARTSPSTLRTAASTLGMSSAGWRSISSTISDSLLPSPTAVSLPALSRAMRSTGWPSTCTPMPRSDSVMLTESTRNGMSSLTICSSVCGDS